jgi:predicted Zn-ribbon and HTH transcriptional regulator
LLHGSAKVRTFGDSHCRYAEGVARRLLNLLTTVSQLLCVVVVVLWVRSYSRMDEVAYSKPPGGLVERSTYLSSLGGRLMFQWRSHTYTPPHTWKPSYGESEGWSIGSTTLSHEQMTFHIAAFKKQSHAGSYFEFDRLGLRLELSRYEDPSIADYGVTRTTLVHVPHWLAAAGFAVLPLAALMRRLRRRRRVLAGLCTRCGYDLRATPGRCPECGNAACNKPVDWMRRLLNLLTALSLLLCVAVAFLWVRSYWSADVLVKVYSYSDSEAHARCLWAKSDAGAIGCGTAALLISATNEEWTRDVIRHAPLWKTTPPSRHEWRVNLLPRVYSERTTTAGGTLHETKVWLPHGLLLSTLAIAPLWWLRHQRRVRRRGHCASCGYDLHATPGRCPECGATPSGGTIAAS